MGNSSSDLKDCMTDEKINRTPPFDPMNYPYPVDFDFITNKSTKEFLSSAYDTISRLEKWKILYEYSTDKDFGILLTHQDEIEQLTDEIEDAYYKKHCGFTIKYTMRIMEYLAKNGIGEFRKLWSTDIGTYGQELKVPRCTRIAKQLPQKKEIQISRVPRSFI
jgi:hypothetical protein